MDDLLNIKFIQQRYTFLYNTKKKVSLMETEIYNRLKILMKCNESNLQLNIISNYLYTINNIELTKLLDLYNPIKYKKTIFTKLSSLNKINDEIKKIIYKIGFDTIDNLVNIIFPNYNYIKDEILEFINSNFVPTKCEIYNNMNHEYDITIIKNLKDYNYSTITKKNSTLFEYINGAIIYLKINSHIFIVTGYFVSDSLNIIRENDIINKKYNNLINMSKLCNINNSFVLKYIDQLSLRDLIIYSNNDILDKIKSDYLKINNYKKNNISFIVKDFLNKHIKEQLEVIILFLLIDTNNIQYMAYLLYDLINNDSYLLKSQPLSDQIYHNLHWSLKKNFKNNHTKIDSNIKNISFNIDEISYEKRIYLMNCNDSVKQKAIDKYKEIINKSNENSSKSQQYLDSLLKIPFNIYKKEEILYLKDDLEFKIKNVINLASDFVYTNNIEYSFINTSSKFLYINMEDSIKSLELFNNVMKTNQNINTIIEAYVKNTKNIEINKLAKTIIKENNLNYKIINSKKEYTIILQKCFNNLSIKNKSKYINLFKVNKKKIDYNTTLTTKINNLILDWNSFKNERKSYIENVDKILNKAIYSQDDAKREIKRIIGQWINGNMNGYCLGFEGPPGIGKTSLAKKGVANCLLDKNGKSRPFSFIALGGSSNGSLLEGHNYTYVGSNYGKIIDILIQTKCMNPIIYIDELDKISNTESGKEIIGILTHLTDYGQNEHFNDKYFSGIDIDLSKVLFIFSYNDFDKIDPILADRIHRIKFNFLQKHEKINIIKNYVIPEQLNDIGYNTESIIIDDNVIDYVITNYTYEAGIRKLKEKMFEIIREINLESIMNNKPESKIHITIEYVKQLFSTKPQVYLKKIGNINKIGVVNGLYATSLGIGGIIPIQITKSFNNNKMDITITGQQGDVMKESIYCAKTIAWNILPKNLQNNITKNKIFGLHLHCPEASTPKDGPSAGGAITLALISLLTNIKVERTIGLTGEIDIHGNITKIGGLDLKIEGGKYAGLKTIIAPLENKLDYDTMKIEKPQVIENINIIFVENIKQIIELCLEKNDIIFNY
jgi:ATP-dependent Lon protease